MQNIYKYIRYNESRVIIYSHLTIIFIDRYTVDLSHQFSGNVTYCCIYIQCTCRYMEYSCNPPTIFFSSTLYTYKLHTVQWKPSTYANLCVKLESFSQAAACT